MTDFTADEWRRMRQGVQALEQEHRNARCAADERARDSDYPYRKQAIEAAKFHADEINKLSLLAAKIWRRASEAAAAKAVA